MGPEEIHQYKDDLINVSWLGRIIPEDTAYNIVANPESFFRGTNFIPGENIWDDIGENPNWSAQLRGEVLYGDVALPKVLYIAPQRLVVSGIRKFFGRPAQRKLKFDMDYEGVVQKAHHRAQADN